MKKVTKAQLIERGKELGLELTMKQTWGAMMEAIDNKEAELVKEESVLIVEKGKLVATKEEVSICGCVLLPKGAIVRINSTEPDEDGDVHCSTMDETSGYWLEVNYLRELTAEEALIAPERFASANDSEYATVD